MDAKNEFVKNDAQLNQKRDKQEKNKIKRCNQLNLLKIKSCQEKKLHPVKPEKKKQKEKAKMQN